MKRNEKDSHVVTDVFLCVQKKVFFYYLFMGLFLNFFIIKVALGGLAASRVDPK